MKHREAQSKADMGSEVRQSISSLASSEAGGAAKHLFALLLVCLLVINGLNVVDGYVGCDFMSSVE